MKHASDIALRAMLEIRAESALRAIADDPTEPEAKREAARAALANLANPATKSASPARPYPRWLHGRTGGAYEELRLREVGPGLWVGNAAAEMPPSLGAAVVQLSTACRSADGAVLRIPVQDFRPIDPAALNTILAFAAVRHPAGPLLVQCRMGLSRSASVAYGLLRLLHKRTHDEALAAVEHTTDGGQGALRWPEGVVLNSVRAWVEGGATP